jgi:hypothetical protein
MVPWFCSTTASLFHGLILAGNEKAMEEWSHEAIVQKYDLSHCCTTGARELTVNL